MKSEEVKIPNAYAFGIFVNGTHIKMDLAFFLYDYEPPPFYSRCCFAFGLPINVALMIRLIIFGPKYSGEAMEKILTFSQLIAVSA